MYKLPIHDIHKEDPIFNTNLSKKILYDTLKNKMNGFRLRSIKHF